MKIQQYIKKLNNTELGKGNTHECYVLVSTRVPGMKEYFFDDDNLNPNFKLASKNNSPVDGIHITKSRELRINGLSGFYSTNNANAGDEILFERRDLNDGNTEFYIDFKARNNTITFQRNAKGFEALNVERLIDKLMDNQYLVECEYNNSQCYLTIQFKESARKRIDSPDLTDFYQILVDDVDIVDDFSNNDFLVLEDLGSSMVFKKVNVWQKYEFNIE